MPDRVHIIAINDASTMDCCVVESGGRFGIIDAGEDTLTPDGSNTYPMRSGVSNSTIGREAKAMRALDALGLKPGNVDFFLGTHAHSDHIGAAPQIIDRYKPATVYLAPYADRYVTTAARLWDNLWVYDRCVQAAHAYGCRLVQNLTNSPTFKLGAATCTILNGDWAKDGKCNAAGEPRVPDANDIAVGLLFEANGCKAWLSADINNRHGDETRLAARIGHVDVAKAGHHGFDMSNTVNYLKGLSPDYLILTAPKNHWGTSDIYTYMRGSGVKTRMYAMGALEAAGLSVATFDFSDKPPANNIPAGVSEWYGSPTGTLYLLNGKLQGAPMATFPTVTDRNVQYPGRIKLKPVSGQTDTYDVELVPGTVSAAGTALDRNFFNSIKTYVDDKQPADRVIGTGSWHSGNNWFRWRKWEGGRAEIWHCIQGNANINGGWGSLFYQTAKVGGIAFPSGCPRIIRDQIITSNVSSTDGRIWTTMSDYYNDRSPSYYLISAYKTTAWYCVSSHMEGLWK